MGQIIELTLDAIAHGGEAIGRHEGKAIFVPYAIPGERARVEIVEEKERWARARLLEVLAPSPDRVAPPCSYFGPDGCGGCQWQHIAYERQAELKQAIVADQLRRLGRVAAPPVADIVALADPGSADDAPVLLDYGYRSDTWFALTADGRLGYRREGGRDVLAIERCLLLDPRLDELHGALDVVWPELTGVGLRVSAETDDALILFEAESDELPDLELDLPAACAALTPRGMRPLVGEPHLFVEVAGRRYRVSAESYFRANPAGVAALLDVVLAYAAAAPSDTVLDLYCGVGLFALALAERAGEVIGVESSPAACDDFAHNAGERINVTLHEGAVEQVLPALRARTQRVDIALLDPPRTGAGPATIRELAALGPRRIVYVTGDPATLARDAVHLAAAGYRLVEVQPIDSAPQTCHVETVALWEARGA